MAHHDKKKPWRARHGCWCKAWKFQGEARVNRLRASERRVAGEKVPRPQDAKDLD